jgi:hypothetical protein
MPRKQKTVDTSNSKVNKKTLMNTLVKNVNSKDEHIILQLPLTQNQIDKITNIDSNKDLLLDPIPYERNCYFINDNVVSDDTTFGQNTCINYSTSDHKKSCCFWCCHPIDCRVYGMPKDYDSINDSYVLYGSFCSLQCANAFNFASYTGCDKVWEINSMIQMMAKRYGIANFVRPAPSRYLLKMFNGYLTIDEFRNLHKNSESTHILNLPPMISISTGYEVLNTSYIKTEK